VTQIVSFSRRTPVNYIDLSELIYPDISKTPADYEAEYPPRDLPAEAKVTRLGPSPTGFIHLGNLYGAFVDERLAHQSGGVFYLRIEDTDDKRFVENAVETIISSLAFFDINFDEGVTADGDTGAYGDYTQSHRGKIYRAFAKKLISEGKAYPCFLSEEEISAIREQQEAAKIAPGIYRGWSKYRDWDTDPAIADEVENRIKNGDEFVIRFKSSGEPNAVGDNIKRTTVRDAIRGSLDVPENFQDIVIIKTTGIPTYHFAHVVDDHLMRTTHVVRGEEWLPSLPIHIELFDALGWEAPVYCHTAQLMKIGDDGNKRKLSKRHDPELSLDYYRNMGYHPAAVREYLMTILNSNYEEWRMANPDAPLDDFEFTTEKMSNSGALFDLDKLNDVSKDTLLRIPASELASFLKGWSDEFAPEYGYMFDDMTHLEKILDIGRSDAKPRKDLVYAKQIAEFIGYFFDESFKIEDEYPAEAAGDAKAILESYVASYDHSDDQETWFGKIREIAVDLGYAAKPKDYKKHPEEYKGHVGHVSTVIRIALMGRATSPDVWTIQQIMGEEKVRARFAAAMER
jgi:glutamyl-tRNA synthetase